MADKEAIELIMEKLKDRSMWVRREAVEKLGEIGDPQAIDLLAQALHDQESYVRSIAAITLAELGDARATEFLITTALENRVLSEAAVFQLKRILESAASVLASNVLQSVAHLNNVVKTGFDWDYADYGEGYESDIIEEVDCSHVRQLAQQELLRRGLEISPPVQI